VEHGRRTRTLSTQCAITVANRCAVVIGWKLQTSLSRVPAALPTGRQCIASRAGAGTTRPISRSVHGPMIKAEVSPAAITVGEDAELDLRITNSGAGACTNVVFTIRLPASFTRLSGRERIDVYELPSGESVVSRLRIRASAAGQYRITSSNFSYRDHLGRSHRETSFAVTITAQEAPRRPPPPEPRVDVDLLTTELPHDKWAVLRTRISNSGEVKISDAVITTSGQISTDERGSRVRIPDLLPGEALDVSFNVCARQPGKYVPVHLDICYLAGAVRRRVEMTRTVQVIRSESAQGVTETRDQTKVKILFLSAEPIDAHRLRLGKEASEILKVIKQSGERDKFDVSIRPAVQATDISQALIDLEPLVVHFAGHGGGVDGSFAAEDESGYAHVIPVKGLVGAFKAVGGSVQCVVVNACSTERLARALHAEVPYVIGMRWPVDDDAAIKFSIGFYMALAGGLSFEKAFENGKAVVAMYGGDDDGPLFLGRQGRP
jgi:uncharacterized repeat protein (TIGR01451 family)